MKILIAGGCGFIGSYLCIYLKKKGFKILSVDNLSKNYCRLNKSRLAKFNIKNISIDLKNYQKLKKIKFRPDLVIDCAAEPAVEVSSKSPTDVVKNNFITTLNLLNFCKNNNSQIIFISSSRIYPIKKSYDLNKKKIKKFTETTGTKGPKSIYGFTKFASELLIEEFSYAYNIKYIVNRLGLTSGLWQFGRVEQGLISLWLWKHLNNQKLSYIGFGGTGNQIRDVLDIEDFSNLINIQIKKFKKIHNQIFCVGGGKKNSFNLKDLTRECSKITGNNLNIKKVSKTSKYDIPYYISSNSKIYKYYKWRPKNSFGKILKKIYIWMSLNEKTLKKYFK